MNPKISFDEELQNYFNEKQEPPPKLKATVHTALLRQDQKRRTRQLWIVALGVAVFALLPFLLLYIFSGSPLALALSAVHVPLSIGGSILLILARNKEKMRGTHNAVLD